MKLLLLLSLLSFNCLAQELNECGQTKEEWTFANIKCLEVSGGYVSESLFDADKPLIIEDSMTMEQFEEEWELETENEAQ
jgi:hypothetical protein